LHDGEHAPLKLLKVVLERHDADAAPLENVLASQRAASGEREILSEAHGCLAGTAAPDQGRHTFASKCVAQQPLAWRRHGDSAGTHEAEPAPFAFGMAVRRVVHGFVEGGPDVLSRVHHATAFLIRSFRSAPFVPSVGTPMMSYFPVSPAAR